MFALDNQDIHRFIRESVRNRDLRDALIQVLTDGRQQSLVRGLYMTMHYYNQGLISTDLGRSGLPYLHDFIELSIHEDTRDFYSFEFESENISMFFEDYHDIVYDLVGDNYELHTEVLDTLSLMIYKIMGQMFKEYRGKDRKYNHKYVTYEAWSDGKNIMTFSNFNKSYESNEYIYRK